MSPHPASARTLLLAALTLPLVVGCSDQPDFPVAPAASPPSLDIQADQRLADAYAAVEKAIALLQAAENPSAPKPKRPFGGHDEKAIRHLEAAQAAIVAAQAYADGTTQ